MNDGEYEDLEDCLCCGEEFPADCLGDDGICEACDELLPDDICETKLANNNPVEEPTP